MIISANNINYKKIKLFLFLSIFFVLGLFTYNFSFFSELLFVIFLILQIMSFMYKFIIAVRFSFPKDENEYINDDNLPLYTILVPLYKEYRIIGQLVDSIEAIDYPKKKLQVLIVVEDDDILTNNYLQKYELPKYFTVIKCINSNPRTKPNACNYALKYATGKYITIYDAEDVPDKMQLKKAVSKFSKLDSNYIALQAKLNFYNYDVNMITRFFSIEYYVWFEIMQKGSELLEKIVILGGTSNHFILEKLKEIGAWDPYNVTEDAELSIRIYNNNYKIATLDSKTLEEAPFRFSSWINQRSRWIKGHLQTYVLYLMSDCVSSFTKRRKFYVHFYIGLPVFLRYTTTYLIIMSVGSLFDIVHFDYYAFALDIAEYLFIFLYLQNLFISVFACVKNKWYSSIKFCFLFPFYNMMHIWAGFKALFQFFSDPFFWEKTEHGFYIKRK